MKSIISYNLIFLIFIINHLILSSYGQRQCCQPGQNCWPSARAIGIISTHLNNNNQGQPIERSYWWKGPGTPFPGPVGINTPESVLNQPLYGAGLSLKGFYERNLTLPVTDVCFVDDYVDEFCLVSMRNNPMDGWQPAFVAFPVNASQVQILVNFAREHSLCVCVLGTGHDFLNRHSCNNGLLIRTSLLKNKQFQSCDNTIKVGTGLTWHETHQFVSQYNRMVVSGWSPTVGIAGWTLGGGHGPYNTHYGLGADNLVEAEIVTSDGRIVIANNRTNRDLWKALRGGGGSTWGVLTSMTIQTHELPVNGFTQATAYIPGDFCTGEELLKDMLEYYLNWTTRLDSNWGGYLITFNMNTSQICSKNWLIYITYHYWGLSNDTNFIQHWTNLTSAFPPRVITLTSEYPYPWSLFNQSVPEVIVPIAAMQPIENIYDGSAPSVIVPREKVFQAASILRTLLTGCLNKTGCPSIQLFQAITGNINSPQNPDTSLSPGMRTGLLHFIFALNSEYFYPLGNYSYFGECAYTLPDWRNRLWGPNYNNLLTVKRKYDPIDLFTCRHCVGDTTP